MRILDLGCNNKKYKGSPGDEVIGVDIQKSPQVDVIHDLEKMPLPFDDNSFDMVYMSHTLEHIPNLRPLMEDIWRILKPSGILRLILPHRSNPMSYGIGHYSYWSLNSFDSIGKPESDIHGFKLIDRNIKLITPFQFLEPLFNRMTKFYEWRLSAFIPASEIEFELVKCKKSD